MSDKTETETLRAIEEDDVVSLEIAFDSIDKLRLFMGSEGLPLTECADNDSVGCAKYLVNEVGLDVNYCVANPEFPQFNSRPALHTAIIFKSRKVAGFLIDHSSTDLNLCFEDDTPLQLALETGQYDIADKILTACPNILSQNNENFGPIYHQIKSALLASKSYNLKPLEYVIAKSESQQAYPSAALEALEHPTSLAFDYLLEKGVDVNDVLVGVAAKPNIEAKKLLYNIKRCLDRGAELDFANNTPMRSALSFRNHKGIDALLGLGVDLDADNGSVLKNMIVNKDIAGFETAIVYGADVGLLDKPVTEYNPQLNPDETKRFQRIVDDERFALISNAIKQDDPNALQSAMAHIDGNVDAYFYNAIGKGPLHLCAENGSVSCASTLIQEYDVDINLNNESLVDWHGDVEQRLGGHSLEPPIHTACRNLDKGDLVACRLLREDALDANIKHNDETPLTLIMPHLPKHDSLADCISDFAPDAFSVDNVASGAVFHQRKAVQLINTLFNNGLADNQTHAIRFVVENTPDEQVFNSTVKEMETSLITGYKPLDDAIKKYHQHPDPGIALELDDTEIQRNSGQMDPITNSLA